MCPMCLCVKKKRHNSSNVLYHLTRKRGMIANFANKSPLYFAKIAIFAKYFFPNSLLNVKPTI